MKGEKTLEQVIVDTDAFFTVMSLKTMEEVRAVETPWTVDLMLGDKRKVKAMGLRGRGRCQ